MEKKDKHFIKQPTYPKGQKAMDAFIASQLKYPEDAYEAGIEGVVMLEYDINHQGKVVAIRILKSLNATCDAEASRVARLLIFEVERTRGLHVIFHKKLNIRFQKSMFKRASEPEKPNIETSTMQLSYTFVPTSSITNQTADTQKSTNNFSYNYTIGMRKE